MNAKELREAMFWGLLLTLISWASVRVGIIIGEKFVGIGPGYPHPGEITEELFRFDSYFYKSIAEFGYSYNGNPWSNPNLGFAPLFPLLVRATGLITGLDTIDAGFILNKVFLFLGLSLLYLVLTEWLPRTRVILILFSMTTAAGSYAFHAYYSESTMLFFLGLMLLCFQRRWFTGVGFSAAALGASRLAAFPMVLAFSILLCIQAWTITGRDRLKLVLSALLCLSGAAAYLAFIGVEFGNPFSLLDEIRKASWGKFYHDVNWIELLTGRYLIDYWLIALSKGMPSFININTLNLVWMSLGLLSGVYLIVAWRRHVLTYLFLPYLFFIYYSTCTSDYLGSTHRYLTSIPAVFLMMSALPAWLAERSSYWVASSVTVGMLLINLVYGWLHTAAFNQGVWFWF